MATAEVRQGDDATIGPCMAELSDGTPIDLTGAKIWASVALARADAAIFTRKNTAGGGSTAEISNAVDPTLGGPFNVYLSSANTLALTVNQKYSGDIRVTTSGGKTYTVGEFEFKIIDPYTAVPT